MTTFRIRQCRHCGNKFTPSGAHQPFCSLPCRFWSKVAIRGADECWPWLAGQFTTGYGVFKIDDTSIAAHRVAFELTFGPLKDQALHTCDWPLCCNYRHLWDGTNIENVADKVNKGRQAVNYGIKSGTAKLTEADVLAIRADPRIHRVIAVDYELSRSCIGKIKSRRNWPHI